VQCRGRTHGRLVPNAQRRILGGGAHLLGVNHPESVDVAGLATVAETVSSDDHIDCHPRVRDDRLRSVRAVVAPHPHSSLRPSAIAFAASARRWSVVTLLRDQQRHFEIRRAKLASTRPMTKLLTNSVRVMIN
jgi:hypothetical protein